jgi:hypothetical protein
MRQATAEDIVYILNNYSREILQRLPLPFRQVQLSMPLDDQPRIKVSVPPGAAGKVPATLSLKLHGRTLEVPLEAVEDLQDYSLR